MYECYTVVNVGNGEKQENQKRAVKRSECESNIKQ